MRKSEQPCAECPRPAIYEDNVPAFELFMDCQTQFSYTNGIPIGLRFEALEFAMKCKGIQHTPEFFDRIKILETAFLGFARDDRERN